jgi:RNA polymerase sigma-70 factor (ECF subfamily)
VRVAAVRTALDLVRQRKPAGSAEAAEDLPAPGADPELDAVRALCRDEFASAFRAAVGALDSERRNALRLHYLDGLTLEETAAACCVSRATVARWMASGREELLAETQRLLRERLRITDGELQSVFRYAQSQLDLSLRRFL